MTMDVQVLGRSISASAMVEFRENGDRSHEMLRRLVGSAKSVGRRRRKAELELLARQEEVDTRFVDDWALVAANKELPGGGKRQRMCRVSI